jgi:hypothetical protein
MCPVASSLLTQVAFGYHTCMENHFLNEVDVFEC